MKYTCIYMPAPTFLGWPGRPPTPHPLIGLNVFLVKMYLDKVQIYILKDLSFRPESLILRLQ